MDGRRAGKLVGVLAVLCVGTGVLLAGLVMVGWRIVVGDIDPGEQAEATDDMEPFCDVLSGEAIGGNTDWYRAALAGTSTDVEAEDLAAVAETVTDFLTGQTPDTYHADIGHAADGLTRSSSEELTDAEVDLYVEAFERLRGQAEEDCAPYWDDAP